MWIDPGEERQRLAQTYSEKWDDELRELAEDMGNLTEVAQQVLRDEMRKRGLGDSPAAPSGVAAYRASARHSGHLDRYHSTPTEAGLEYAPGDDQPLEYTWKTPLCPCDSKEHAWQLTETLRRAGIDSWVETPRSSYALELSGPRILVAADQLEHARAIIAQPIPDDIIQDSMTEPEPFELPQCPSCGAPDPVLMSVEPANHWECEACGREWDDHAPTPPEN